MTVVGPAVDVVKCLQLIVNMAVFSILLLGLAFSRAVGLRIFGRETHFAVAGCLFGHIPHALRAQLLQTHSAVLLVKALSHRESPSCCFNDGSRRHGDKGPTPPPPKQIEKIAFFLEVGSVAITMS